MSPDYNDLDVPEASPVDETVAWDTPAGVPVNAQGVSLIPELVDRPPTHNESVLLSGIPVKMGSTNVDEIWFNWEKDHKYYPRLFVKFLDGSIYVYNDCPLSVAAGMVDSLSPGRYVWNVLRPEWPTSTGAAKCLVKGQSKGRRKPQVVRIHSRKSS